MKYAVLPAALLLALAGCGDEKSAGDRLAESYDSLNTKICDCQTDLDPGADCEDPSEEDLNCIADAIDDASGTVKSGAECITETLVDYEACIPAECSEDVGQVILDCSTEWAQAVDSCEERWPGALDAADNCGG